MTDTILWRRLDKPGHEAAELAPSADGWLLSGTAVFAESGRPCRLDYTIRCDRAFVTRHCMVSGLVGTSRVRLDVERASSGAWSVNGARESALDGCIDVDLGFSPSTNLLPIRRLSLPVGAAAPVRAAWVRFPELTVEILEQSYTRIAADRYLYESAGGTFRRELTVDDTGFVLEYPGLWLSAARASASAS
jgi:uncharacterized protein